MRALIQVAYINMATAVIYKNMGDIITANKLVLSAIKCLILAQKLCR